MARATSTAPPMPVSTWAQTLRLAWPDSRLPRQRGTGLRRRPDGLFRLRGRLRHPDDRRRRDLAPDFERLGGRDPRHGPFRQWRSHRRGGVGPGSDQRRRRRALVDPRHVGRRQPRGGAGRRTAGSRGRRRRRRASTAAPTPAPPGPRPSPSRPTSPPPTCTSTRCSTAGSSARGSTARRSSTPSMAAPPGRRSPTSRAPTWRWTSPARAAGPSPSYATLYRTVDDGATWTECQLPGGAPTVQDLDFWNASIGYAVGSDGYAARSGDGGLTWQMLPTPDTTRSAHRHRAHRRGRTVGEHRRRPGALLGHGWTELGGHGRGSRRLRLLLDDRRHPGRRCLDRRLAGLRSVISRDRRRRRSTSRRPPPSPS